MRRNKIFQNLVVLFLKRCIIEKIVNLITINRKVAL